MDEDDRRVIGFQRQRLIVGFERRHIEKIREAPGLFIVRDDCPKGMFMESLTPRPELENTHRAGQKGGPGRPNIKPSGMEQASEPKFPGSSGNQRPRTGQYEVEAFGPRGTDRQSRRTTARLPVQRLHELRGAGFGDPPACCGFPLRALADLGLNGAGAGGPDGGATGSVIARSTSANVREMFSLKSIQMVEGSVCPHRGC